MLDEVHERPSEFVQLINDENSYTFGRIGGFNIIIASLSAGESGSGATARIVANGLRASCPHLRIALSVGIGAGIPNEQGSILLGDVVVNYPQSDHGGIIQYTFDGTNNPERLNALAQQPRIFRDALSALQVSEGLSDVRLEELLTLFEKNEKVQTDYRFPGADKDPLRSTTARQTPAIHFGTIASSHTAITTTSSRDRMNEWLETTPLCLDTEAATMAPDFPYLAIRGICDYADENKNDAWQKYAAATAAACAKRLIGKLDAQAIVHGKHIDRVLGAWAGAYRKGVEVGAAVAE